MIDLLNLLSSNPLTAVLIVISFFILCILVVIAFAQNREIVLGPIKIGARLKSLESTSSAHIKSPDKITYITSPQLFPSTGDSKLRVIIKSDFLRWDRCTLMIWVDVPPKGTGLRALSTDYNRYLIAHQIGDWNTTKGERFNLFALRWRGGEWELAISNNEAVRPPDPISLRDDLQPGWHQFVISWSRPDTKLLFLIDGGKTNQISTNTFVDYWPGRYSGTVRIGAWASDLPKYDNRYCDTSLYQLEIVDRFIQAQPIDRVVAEHLDRKPNAKLGSPSAL